MNLPEKIKIGGFTIEVIEKSHEMRDEDRFGYYSPGNQKIFIDNSNTQQKKEETLLHEIMEAIDSIYDLQLEHHKISLIATVFHQVLKDNNLNISGE